MLLIICLVLECRFGCYDNEGIKEGVLEQRLGKKGNGRGKLTRKWTFLRGGAGRE